MRSSFSAQAVRVVFAVCSSDVPSGISVSKFFRACSTEMNGARRRAGTSVGEVQSEQGLGVDVARS